MFFKSLSYYLSQKTPHKALANYILKCSFCTHCQEKNVKMKYKFLLVLDFEATCIKKGKMQQEIIEFPCLKVNIDSLNEESRFHHYVRPVINPVLSDFCIELTGILQEMVDNEKTFPEVLELFTEWREKEGLTSENSLYVTSGDWDLGHMMPNQCKISGVELPSHVFEWTDIKKLYGFNNKYFYNSLREVVQNLGLQLYGKAHSGIDDCINIYNVAQKLINLGIEFKPTSKLTVAQSNYKVESLFPNFINRGREDEDNSTKQNWIEEQNKEHKKMMKRIWKLGRKRKPSSALE